MHIPKFKSYMKSEDIRLIVYGITRNTITNEYLVVFDGFHPNRNFSHGICTHCNRYNTSKAWCQSCDPQRISQMWTSGNEDIDDCINLVLLNTIR